MPSREELFDWDRRHLWHPFTQMAEYQPAIFCRAEGCLLYDLDGREYIDAVSSLWCNVHGHRHPRLDAALKKQLDLVAHTTLLGASNPATIELARRLVEIAPAGLEHVFFSDDGATAVEVALKMAFAYWRQRADPRPEKTAFLAFGDAYHGDTLGSVSVGGVQRFHALFAPLLFEVLRAPSPDTYRLPSGGTRGGALEYYADAVEEILKNHHRRLAAIIVEPLVQCAAGMVVHPPGFLARLRELASRYEVLLIVDEVATGFGRTGRMFACEHEQVAADLLCLAKGLTAGYLPMAATLASGEIWQAFRGTFAEGKTFFHGHTYGGNPLAAAVALASIDIFREEQTLDRVAKTAARLAVHLARIRDLAHVGDVRQVGLIAGIELVKNRETKEPFDWEFRAGHRVCEVARTMGVWLRPLGNVVAIFPPLSIAADQLDRIALAVESGIRQLHAPPLAVS